jgi:acetyltransferase-like isoleucine patch superfamily enzyme
LRKVWEWKLENKLNMPERGPEKFNENQKKEAGSDEKESLIDERTSLFESEIGEGVEIRPFAVIRNSEIGNGCAIYENAVVKKSKIGERSIVNCGSYLENVEIREDVLIGPNCSIVGAGHEFSEKSIAKEGTVKFITIGKNSWLGAGCKVVPGIVIGEGCVIGMGSVVNKNVPDHHIFIGIPGHSKCMPISEWKAKYKKSEQI